MQLKLFHASTVKINNFYIPYGGLHFGGVSSALEAALRKVRAARYDIKPLTEVYLHTCILNVKEIEVCFDMCGADDWEKEMELVRLTTRANAIKYWNKYEPDVEYSYLIWDSSLVSIESVKVLTEDEAEDMLKDNLCLI